MIAMRKNRSRRRGVAALEFALVLPIFLLIVFGIIELGRAVMVYQILTNGAREGARYAIVPGRTSTKTYDVIDNFFANTTIAGHSRTVSPLPEDANSGDALTVTVSVPFSQVAWGTDWLGMGSSTFTVTSVMRKE